MMNVVAMGVVLSTLAAAGVWSPAPPANHHAEPVVREGRRVIVVEYERELPLSAGDLKEPHIPSPHALAGEARDAISDVAGEVSDAAESGKEKLSVAMDSAKDKVFDAVKRCKDKACGAAKRAEEGAKDKAWLVQHGAEDAVRGAKDKVLDAALQAKETVGSAKDKVSGAAKNAKESTKDKASYIHHEAKETVKNAKDNISGAAKNAEECAKEKASAIQHEAKDTVKSAKDKVSDVAERAEEYAQDATGSMVEKAVQAEEAAKAKASEVRKNLTGIVRRARDVAADAALYLAGTPKEAARTVAAVLHLLGFATAYGTCVWVTFVSSHVLAMALPRQQLGMVQSKLYPVYFRAVAYSVGLALVAHLLGRDRRGAAESSQSYNLLCALALAMANVLLLEPKATKVMFERMKLEKEEGRGRDMVDSPTAMANLATVTTAAAAPSSVYMTAAKATADPETAKGGLAKLNKRLKRLNGYSSLCNVLGLMALTWHLVHLARRLQASSAL